ncbi:MAG: hypothetical protein ACODAD_07625, partial [Planctomycetota bacterium]
MGTVLVAIAGVFVVLGLWMVVQLLANKHLGERSPGCGCGLHPGGSPDGPKDSRNTCGRCTVQLSDQSAS